MASETHLSEAENDSRTAVSRRRTHFSTGRSGLIMPGVLVALGLYLLVGIITMEVPEGAKSPGPKFFPILITIAIFALAALMIIQLLRRPEPVPAEEVKYRTYSDWKTVAKVVLGFLTFTLLLIPIGWLISAAFLFWIVAHALGSKRPLNDIGVAVVFSSCIQLAFGAALGLNLPAGTLEGLLG